MSAWSDAACDRLLADIARDAAAESSAGTPAPVRETSGDTSPPVDTVGREGVSQVPAEPMVYDAFHRAPVGWDSRERCMVCDICGAKFRGHRKPGDRGSFPSRNRARGAAIKHVNAAHGRRVTKGDGA